MAQHDMNIANQGFPATRADLNNALQALASNNSGTSAPSTMFANQWWYDTTNNKLYIRNEANNAWIQVAVLDQTNNEWQVITGVIQAKDGDGLVFKTDDGTTRIAIADSDGDVAFDTDTLYVDAGNDKIGVNMTDPDGQLHVYNGMLQVGSKDGDTSTQQNTNAIRIAAVPASTSEWGGLQWYREFSNYIGAEIIAARASSSESKTDLIFKTSATGANASERMRIRNDGGLTFNGDTAAANALDDYEEGTWTPAIGGLSPATITGCYTKIGDLCYVGAFINFGSTGDGSQITISGFPFACTSDNDGRAGLSMSYSTRTTFTSVLMNNSASTANFRNLGGSIPTNADFSGKVVHFGGVYKTP